MNTKPNIVFVLCDNVGWGDPSVYGGTVSTPNIDKLAADGLRFTNYTVELQCVPTRSAIMTGRLPVRSGTIAVPLPGHGDYGLAPWEFTLGKMFQQGGYATGLFGKWHLGDVEGKLPTDQGFDTWWGIRNSSCEAGYSAYARFAETGQEVPYVWTSVKGGKPERVMPFDLENRPIMDQEICSRTCDFISEKARAGTPFFAYVGLTSIHSPLRILREFQGRSGGGSRADSLVELDTRIGQIRQAVEDAGIADNTLFVFSSDNAALQISAEMGGSNGPWRGNFYNPPFEGSHRVPCIACWPGQIQKGAVSSEIFSAIDWLPTLAAMTGLSHLVPDDRPIDGVDISGHMVGQTKKSGRDHVMFFGSDGELMSVKWNEWKVIFRYCEGAEKPVVTSSWPIIYDLLTDPGERWNTYERYVDTVWVMHPVYKIIADLNESIKVFPNLKPGESVPSVPRLN